VPKRRTAFTFDVPAGVKLYTVPAVIDVDETWYIKPEAGRLLGSPADETPSEPCDAQPEELDLAVAVDRIEQALAFAVGRFHSKWAGLRSFVADKTMVAGFAASAPGFFWLAGQGGYGIQTSPGMGRIAAALARGRPLPADIADRGVEASDLASERPGIGVQGST
jgi:D-arginine dehydrogenase